VSLPALRQQLAALSPPPHAGTATIPTGLPALDGVLSGGGLPSGRLTELLGRRGSGRTTLVRQLVAAAVEARRWVAVVDGSRTLAPRDWAAIGDSGRLWVVRPPGPDRGAWCADILLRSGAFSLVVLDSVPALPHQVAVRLTRLAREHDVALVVTGEVTSGVVGSAVRLRIEKRAEGRGQRADKGRGQRAEPAAPRPAPHESRITISVEKGGSHHPVEVRCAIDVARRLCAHPEVPDRRGVAKRNRRGELVDAAVVRTGNAHGSSSAIAAHNATLPYKRRCAETPRDWLDDTPGRSLLGREADRPDRVATRARGNRGRRTLADPRGHDGYGGQSALRRRRRATVG
jgi:hypothetical protein